MLLRAVDGSELELTVVGYQFPHAMNVRDDWLLLSIRMKIGAESWEARDPALVWEEARDLANFLDGIARDDPSAGWHIEFVEPVLLFEAFRRAKDTILLRVYCQAFPSPAPGDHFSRMFLLARQELRKGATDLRSELQKFPSRFPIDESPDDDD